MKKAAPGISKGASLLQEIRDKREQGKKIKFTITLWKSKPTKGKGGIQLIAVRHPILLLIPNVRPVENINEDMPTYDALDYIVTRVQEYHGRAFPSSTKIHRESATKYANIPEDVLTGGTVTGLLSYFRSNSHISDAQFAAKQLELKLVVNEAELYPEGDTDFAMPSARAPSRSRGSVRDSVAPANPISRASVMVRKSAWPVKTAFSRPCEMVTYKFRRYIKTKTAEGVVDFLLPDDAAMEDLLVAADWMEGASMAKSAESLQARVNNEEYALGQAQDVVLDHGAHLQMLTSELKNLYNGEMVLKDFYGLAEELAVALPSFKFNVDGAILGVLEPFQGSGNNDVLQMTHFLATRFLPCGPADLPIQKFTGNTDCGPEPENFLTQAIHAFSHYAPIFTSNELVLCDLQGMCDRKGVMTLVDPQSHSQTATCDPSGTTALRESKRFSAITSKSATRTTSAIVCDFWTWK
ncbi:hypothetical protein C8R46DRAFT_1037822 [Mycena filopes]|nr:hypothetical protein C8R46DRAFT_1037822 [Mycena filopes]